MKFDYKKYSKFFVALAAALAVATSVSADGEFSMNDLFAVSSALVGAMAVERVPNQQKSAEEEEILGDVAQ